MLPGGLAWERARKAYASPARGVHELDGSASKRGPARQHSIVGTATRYACDRPECQQLPRPTVCLLWLLVSATQACSHTQFRMGAGIHLATAASRARDAVHLQEVLTLGSAGRATTIPPARCHQESMGLMQVQELYGHGMHATAGQGKLCCTGLSAMACSVAAVGTGGT
jgi:hypothetical protein